MSLRHSLPLASSLLALALVAGCATEAVDDASTGEALQQSARGTICEALGTNEPTLLEISGNQLTMTRRGGQPEVGTKAASPAPGFDGYRFNNETLWVSVDRSKVELHEDNVGPHWESNCHPATAAELSADACAILLRDMGYGKRAAQVEKLSGGEYRVTSSAAAGKFVWSADSSGTGFRCRVDLATLQPVSCPAVVYDAIGDKARDDGSSAGSPYVNKKSDTSWTGGIHDPESGEFSYAVKTDSAADHCKVVSIVSTGDSQ
jgi:hypothetical protein